MKRITLIASALAIVAVGVGAVARPAAAGANLCVAHTPGCFQTLQAAVDAAHDGDTIRIDRGTFAGGVTVGVSVAIVGAGASQTTISGGGPVLTLGVYQAATEPTISVSGVTITGGDNTTLPDLSVTFGGGVWIPQSQVQSTGATVSISNSVITGNTVTPSQTFPGTFCGSPNPCAFGDGGGIDNAGVLTLTNTVVSNNQAGTPGGVGSGLADGGIHNRFIGTLVMRHCQVTGNRALAGPPNGNGSSAGGIGDDGPMTIEDSVVSNNTVTVLNAGASDEGAFAGGVALAGFASPSVTIRNTTISNNSVSDTNAGGDAGTFAGGIFLDVGASLVLDSAAVNSNDVASTGSGGAFTDGGGMELDGTATVTRTLIARNSIIASARSGPTFAQGGGVANTGTATFRGVLVVGNTVSAQGPDGVAQGGGIWNSRFDDSAPLPSLTLIDTIVTANSVTASSGTTLQGGGVFSITPVARTNTLIAGNRPDQCSGC
jgi:hypothetical protein